MYSVLFCQNVKHLKTYIGNRPYLLRKTYWEEMWLENPVATSDWFNLSMSSQLSADRLHIFTYDTDQLLLITNCNLERLFCLFKAVLITN